MLSKIFSRSFLFFVLGALSTAPGYAVEAEQAAQAPQAVQSAQATALDQQAAPAAEEPRLQPGDTLYVSDKANVWLRSGPSTNYRIIATRHVGDELKFVRLSENGKFTEIEDETGRYWMQTADVQPEPCGKAQAEILQQQIKVLEDKLANYDSEAARQYNAAAKKLEKLEAENAGLKKTLEQKDATIQNMDQERRDYADRLETKELDMQMRWWMQGALIAFCGAVIGIVFVFIPHPHRKNKRERF